MAGWLVVSCLLLVVSSSWAQDVTDLALRRGIGGRSAGMGGAFTAVADDGAAIFYNPAGLSEKGFAYTYGNPDTSQDKVLGSFEFLKLGFIGYGSWKVKDSSGAEVNTSALGFGNKSGWFSWGLSYKNLDWTLSGVKSEGWSSDFGFMLRITPNLKVGILAQDLLTSKDYLVPAGGRLGLSFSPLDQRLILASDIEISRNLGISSHLGIETKLVEGFSLRLGLDRGEVAAGATLDLSVFSLDYAALFGQDGKTVQRYEAGLKILPQRERPFSLIKPKEYALIDITGGVKAGRTQYSLLGGLRPGVDSILESIRRAYRDTSIDGILIKVGGMGGGLGGMAMVQELRGELLRAKAKGKKIVAYLEGGALGDEYYLAAAADKVVAPPGAIVGGFGKSIEIYRAKELFKKLGIEWQVLAKGRYKTAFDWLSPEMTDEQREMMEGIVANLYRQMLTEISKDRKISLGKLKEIGTGMVFSSKQAKELGLIDEIGYLEDIKKEARLIEPRLVEEEVALFTQVFGVAVIEIDGEIISGKSGENVIFGGRYIGSETVTEYIKKASEDPFVRAIILRINSPGGSAVAAGEIYKAVRRAKEEKKKIMIASLGGMGASGGYYVAASADKIMADPASITGSIGVMGALPVYQELMQKVGVTAEVVKEGKHADMFSGLRKLTPQEMRALEGILDETYQEFIQAVVEGRKMPTSEVEEAAQGRVYTGEQAQELKLVDELGGFYDAVELAKKEAKIAGEPRLIFYYQPSILFQIGGQVTESIFPGLLQDR